MTEDRSRASAVRETFRPPATDLPPWLPVRRPNRLDLDGYREPGRFFVTASTSGRQPWFRRDAVARYCADALRESCSRQRFELVAYCFIPDHLHFLVESEQEGTDLVRLVRDFKQRTGWWFRNRYQAGGLKASPTGFRPSLWQRSYYDHVLGQDDDSDRIVRYILDNPVDACLVEDAFDYPYSWCAYDWPERILASNMPAGLGHD
ncbi:MAG: transposase [Dehalococcoidia bacterium]